MQRRLGERWFADALNGSPFLQALYAI